MTKPRFVHRIRLSNNDAFQKLIALETEILPFQQAGAAIIGG